MNTRNNQLELIEAIQQLLGIAIENNEFELIIAMSDVLKNLFVGLSHLPSANSGLEPVTKLRPPINRSSLFNRQQQPVLPTVTQPPMPPQPSSYVWGDGFHGVTLPTRKENDAWEDS